MNLQTFKKSWTDRVSFLLSLPAPNVVLNVTAEATDKSIIMVTWKIEKIHDQLIARNLTIEYCEMERNKSEVNTRCNPCRHRNVTNISTVRVGGSQSELLTGLRSYTTYRIKAKAGDIAAKDGTEVTTPYGKYSNPSYNETNEDGEEFVFLKIGFSLHSSRFLSFFRRRGDRASERKAPRGGGGTPLYGLYRYVRPQRVWFFGCFGHK